MIKIDETTLQDAIIERAADQLIGEMEGISGLVRDAVDRRVGKIFAETAEAEIQERIKSAINDALNREYFRTDNFGQRQGEGTTIAKQLDRMVSGYWSEKVDGAGKPTSNSYGTPMTRAEYIMSQICAKDFSDQMRQAAVSVTAALKDGFRAQMAGHVDKLLDELFRVKSLQDQGKATKPW